MDVKIIMIENTIHCKLDVYIKTFSGYDVCVFINLKENCTNDDIYNPEFVVCKILPNWEMDAIHINDIGYLSYIKVKAGKDTWYDKTTGKDVYYKYNGVYLMSFVPDKSTQQDIIL